MGVRFSLTPPTYTPSRSLRRLVVGLPLWRPQSRTPNKEVDEVDDLAVAQGEHGDKDA